MLSYFLNGMPAAVANLFDPPGTPLGTAHHAERAKIRAHLLAKGWSDNWRLEARVTWIQMRLHKYDKSLKERQAEWNAKQPKPAGAGLNLTWEELERLVDLFTGANDPVTASIAAKAAEALAKKDA
jgi:hypothetical protein